MAEKSASAASACQPSNRWAASHVSHCSNTGSSPSSSEQRPEHTPASDRLPRTEAMDRAAMDTLSRPRNGAAP